MGASLLGAMLEKLGVSGNAPLREIGLSQYVMGALGLKSSFMQCKTVEMITILSGAVRLGGVSALIRDNQEPTKRADKRRIDGMLGYLYNHKYESIKDLYFDCKYIFEKSIIYKTPLEFSDFCIEFSTDLLGEKGCLIAENYRKEFGDVYVINLHRDFDSWVNSLAIQAKSKPNFYARYRYFTPVGLARRYVDYEYCARQIGGLHIDFDDMLSNPEFVFHKIASFLGKSELLKGLHLENEEFDIWSTQTSYEVAFEPAEDNLKGLGKSTRKYMRWLINKNLEKAPFLERFGRFIFLFDLASNEAFYLINRRIKK